MTMFQKNEHKPFLAFTQPRFKLVSSHAFFLCKNCSMIAVNHYLGATTKDNT